MSGHSKPEELLRFPPVNKHDPILCATLCMRMEEELTKKISPLPVIWAVLFPPSCKQHLATPKTAKLTRLFQGTTMVTYRDTNQSIDFKKPFPPLDPAQNRALCAA